MKKNPIKTKVDKSPLTQSLSFSLSPPLCIALPVSHPPALFQMFLPDFGTKLNFLHLMFLLCDRNRTFLPSAKSLLVYIFLFCFFRGNAQYIKWKKQKQKPVLKTCVMAFFPLKVSITASEFENTTCNQFPPAKHPKCFSPNKVLCSSSVWKLKTPKLPRLFD